MSVILVAHNAVAAGDDLSLSWAFDGAWLYLATEGVSTTSELDHFILVDRDPAGTRSAPWAKAGTVAGWEYFLGNEDSNNWSGWFDGAEDVLTSASAEEASGDYLEGALDLAALFGSVPDSILVAALGYATPDGGALEIQAPEGNGNGDVEPDEYAVLHLTGSGVSGAPGLRVSLLPVHPNPCAGEATIRFEIPARARVEASVYDVSGRLVARLAEGELPGGEHGLRWDGLDRSGRRLPSGVYFVRLAALGESVERKIVLLK